RGRHAGLLSSQSTPGVQVTALLSRSPATPGVKPPALVLLHGGGAAGKDGAGPKSFAELLSRAGWTVLSLDMQYFGERSTGLLTTFSDPEKHEKLYNQPSAYLAFITQSVKDISRAIDFLVDQRGVDPQRVGFVGMSRGAIVGAIAAGADRRPSPVGMVYGGPFDALQRGHLPARWPANHHVPRA